METLKKNINWNELSEPVSIFALSPDDWDSLMVELGQKPYRGRQVRIWIYEKFISDFNRMTDLLKSLQARLAERLGGGSLKLEKKLISSIDNTQKFLWSFKDKIEEHFFESVLNYKKKKDNRKEKNSESLPLKLRSTACLSSQTGCRVGCSFCKTSRMKSVHNLPSWAIVEQFWQMCKENGNEKINNIVFMGMGEPFHNYGSVIFASDRFTDSPGLSLNPKRITISTSGILPVMERYMRESRPYNLAISLNAPDNIRRKKIIPHADRWMIEDFLDYARRFTKKNKKRITFEYVLIPSFNDSPKDAYSLGKMLKEQSVKLNVIPYNPIDTRLNPPSENTINKFIREYLRGISEGRPKRHGAPPITIRRSAGIDISGACGQLACDADIK